MEASVIIIDSDDEDNQTKDILKEDTKTAPKRPASGDLNGEGSPLSKIRRIQPTKIGEIGKDSVLTKTECPGHGSGNLIDSSGSRDTMTEENETGKDEPGPSAASNEKQKNQLTQELEHLIRACRAAECTEEMKKVIKQKLLKYYHSVHPDYVTSKNFRKTLETTAGEIEKEPHLAYMKLKHIIEELDARRKSKAPYVVSKDDFDVKQTGDEAKDKHLKKLYKAMVKVKRRIADLEEAEVDLDDDESSYVQKVRYEKRACQIYEKICELTGESTHAHRIVKKPIKFKGTVYPDFNKKITKIVNEKNSFPNFMDVSKCLDYCNKKHNLGLVKKQMEEIAKDAFEKLGKLLQERRKRDFYETAQFYVGENKDPAKEDPELRSQLEKNKKFYSKYDDIINEYAEKEQKDHSDAEEVSSTSKNETPVVELKNEPEDESALPDDQLETHFDKHDTSIEDESKLIMLF